MSETEKELITRRRALGEALKQIWKAEASAQYARRNIEAQLFEVEDKINKFEGLQG